MPINKIRFTNFPKMERPAYDRLLQERISERVYQVTMIEPKDFWNGKNRLDFGIDKFDISRLPKIESNSADIITTFGVLDKLTRPELNMAFIDMARILTPKGWLVNVYKPTDKLIFTRDCHQIFFTYALDEDFSLFRRK